MSTQEIPVDIRGFRGINLRESAADLQENELVECVNFDIGRNGELKRRKAVWNWNGQTGIDAEAQIEFLGYYYTVTNSQIFVETGFGGSGEVKYSNDAGQSWASVGTPSGTGTWAVQYADDLYIITTGGVDKWNGSTLSNIAAAPGGSKAVVHKDRLFVFGRIEAGVGQNKNRVYFSAIGDFSTWPSTNFIDVQPGDGDAINAAIVYGDHLMIFKSNSIWILYVQGAPENWVLKQVYNGAGCNSKRGVTIVENYLYFIGLDGIYQSDGISFKKISDDIAPYFNSRRMAFDENIDCIVHWQDKLICYVNSNTNDANEYFVYHFVTQGWTTYEFIPDDEGPTLELTSMVADFGRGRVYSGDMSGRGKFRWFKEDDGPSGDDSPSLVKLVTKKMDFGIPHVFKRGKWLSLNYTGTTALQLTYRVDDTADVVVDVPASDGLERAIKLRGPGFFRRLQIELSGDILFSDPGTLHGITLYTSTKRPVSKAIS